MENGRTDSYMGGNGFRQECLLKYWLWGKEIAVRDLLFLLKRPVTAQLGIPGFVRQEKTVHFPEIVLLVTGHGHRLSEHDTAVGEIKGHSNNGHFGTAGNVVETGFPALDPGAGAFRRDRQNKTVGFPDLFGAVQPC